MPQQSLFKSIEWNAASWRSVCIMLCVALSAEFVRAAFPSIIFNPQLDQSGIALNFTVIFLAPLLAIFMLYRHKFHRRRTPNRLVDFALFLLIVARAGLLLFPAEAPIFVSLGAVAAILLLNSLFYESENFTIPCLLGLALSTALNAAFSTWDMFWQPTPFSAFIGLTFCVGIVFSAWKAHQPPSQSAGQTPLPQMIGWYVFFALQLLIFHNVGFVTALTGSSWLLAVMLILLGDCLTLLVITRRLSPHQRMVAGAAVVVLLLLLNAMTSWIAAIALLLAQIIIGALVIPNATPKKKHPIWLIQLTSAFGSVISLGLVLLWYLGYQFPMPLWFPGVVQALAGLILVLIFSRTSRPLQFPILAAVPLAFLLIPLSVNLFHRTNVADAVSSEESIRFMSYNVHQGANIDGLLDLEGIARTIEAENPHVVVLQEVTRGQLITGSVDMAEWLASRLGMSFCFAPAADFTFGELLLSALPIKNCLAEQLGKGNTAQFRSYVSAVIETGDGILLTIIGTHLDHTNEDIRAAQTSQLLTGWNRVPRTLIAGDMNAIPESLTIQQFENVGLISAQDFTDNSALPTFPSIDARVRIDWIFGTPDLVFSQFVIPQSTASDHLPVAVTVTWKN